MLSRRHLLCSTIAAGPFLVHSFPALAQMATPQASPTIPDDELIVDVAWLQDRLGDSTVKVIALQDAKSFGEDHIAGAAQIDWDALELPVTTEAEVDAWRAKMAALFASLGVGSNDTVVAYDPGTFYAARVWWVLDQIGHADKRLLSGGLPGWTAAGGNTESGAFSPDSSAAPLPVIPNDDGIATIDEVISAVDSNAVTFIDARMPSEYEAGHIPGAINIPMLSNAVDGEIHYWKSAADLRAMYAAAGITAAMHVVPYCSTGVRSANTHLAMRVIGHDRVSLFSGSWDEYSMHPDLPVTKGATP